MNTKLDLSKPAGYPPNVSDSKGNKKKLNGPNHSGRRCLNTLGVVTTIRIIAGRSSHFGSLDGNCPARRPLGSTRSIAVSQQESEQATRAKDPWNTLHSYQ